MGIMLALIIAFAIMMCMDPKPIKNERLRRGGFATLMACFFAFDTYVRVRSHGVNSIEPFHWFVLGVIFMGAVASWVMTPNRNLKNS